MELISAIEDAAVVRKILDHLGLPTRGPPTTVEGRGLLKISRRFGMPLGAFSRQPVEHLSWVASALERALALRETRR